MSELIYEFVKGEGWVPERPAQTISWEEFRSYRYDKHVCIYCNETTITHYYGYGLARCKDANRDTTDIVGKFRAP